MSNQADAELRLLRRLLALYPTAWEGPSATTRLPANVRLFLGQADVPTLEQLLIETAQRLDSAPAADPRSRANLHESIQAELRFMQQSSDSRHADHSS